jgi:hypothetical protein
MGRFGAKLLSRTPVGSAPPVLAKSQTKSQDGATPKRQRPGCAAVKARSRRHLSAWRAVRPA